MSMIRSPKKLEIPDEFEDAELKAQRFDRLNNMLRKFCDQNSDVFDEFQELVNERNSALEEAIVAAKASLGSSSRNSLTFSGGISVSKMTVRKWDGCMLSNIFPERVHRDFLTEKIDYDVDKKKLEDLIRQGDLDEITANRALSVSVTLKIGPKTPKAIVM